MNLQTPAISTFQKPAARALGSRRSRRGFTLIELLVVIGIILILMGLFFVGAKIVTAQAKERDTRTMLETCSTLFANYRSATNLSRPPITIPVPRFTNPIWCNIGGMGTSTPPQFWSHAQVDAPDPGQVPSTSPYVLPNNLSTVDPAVLDTICVMYTLESIPENKTIINNLPPSKILNVSFTNKNSGTSMTVPLILDGWGNPILFVPGGGFGMNAANASSGSFPYSSPAVVYVDGVNFDIVTSAGMITNLPTSPVPIATYNAASLPSGVILTNQPFFVSAGPDGDFANSQSKTDDNIYSFR